MKRIVIFLAFIFLLGGCSALERLPELKVSGSNNSINAVLGTYSWTRVQADSVAPPELVRYQKGSLSASPKSSITLSFNSKPQNYEVYIWKNNSQITQKQNNGEIIVPDQKGLAVYEVYAQWREGSAHYAFSVNVE